MKKLILGIFFGSFLLISGKTFAATVTCQFMSGTTYSKSGVWIKEGDPMTIMELFGYEGLKLKLENSLLANLDARKIFLAGETKHGKVFLLGSDMGVLGKAIKVDGDNIRVYDGMCDIGFG